jgi:hypothetical protein
VAGVEAGGHRRRVEDRDVGWQNPVQAPRVERLLVVGRDLPPGVDAGVGAPGYGHRDLLLQDRRDRRLELLLNGAPLRLARPAGEVRPVVLEQELGREAHWFRALRLAPRVWPDP